MLNKEIIVKITTIEKIIYVKITLDAAMVGRNLWVVGMSSPIRG